MRKNFGKQTWFYPLPVAIISTYNADGTPNAMNAAWASIVDYNQIQVNLAPHRTTENIKREKVFTLSFADTKHVVEADYLGIVSGDDVPDKIAKCGLTTSKADYVNAPVIEEFPMTLECEVVSINDNLQVVANIVNVTASVDVLDEKGTIDPTKLHIICYDSVKHNYFEMGDIVGYAFSDGKKIK